MKRIVTTLFVVSMFMLGGSKAALSYYSYYYDNFGELNVKAGLQFVDGMSYTQTSNNESVEGNVSLGVGFCLSGECLIYGRYISENLELFRFGLGLSYLFPRGLYSYEKSEDSYSYLPIYFTLQANPFFKSFDEWLHGIFVKGNIGYSVLFDFKTKNPDWKLTNNGGLYFGISAGYEFPFGLIFDLGYHVYKSATEAVTKAHFVNKLDFTASNITLNVGYKFKI